MPLLLGATVLLSLAAVLLVLAFILAIAFWPKDNSF